MWLSLQISSPFLSCGSDCFATTVSSWNRGIYTTACIFLNIYFVENKDRYLIEFLPTNSMICLQVAASLIVCIDLTDGFFSTTDSVLCLFCLFVFTEAFMFSSRKLSNTLDSQRKDARVVDEDVGRGTIFGRRF